MVFLTQAQDRYRSIPDRRKKTDSDQNSQVYYASTSMTGWRTTMDEAHKAIVNLSLESPISFFAVYTGYGGSGDVAQYAAKYMHKQLLKEIEQQGEGDYPAALDAAFIGIDDNLADHSSAWLAGTTSLVVLVAGGTVHVANAGNSRCVLSVKGLAKALNLGHVPEKPTERTRIKAAGGFVIRNAQWEALVNGKLASSRGLGYFNFKKDAMLMPDEQIIIPDPEIFSREITGGDEFLVLASPGIWACLSSQQVVDIIRTEVSKGKTLSEVCEIVCEHCLTPFDPEPGFAGHDNMSIIIVALLQQRSIEQWAAGLVKNGVKNHRSNTPIWLSAAFSPIDGSFTACSRSPSRSSNSKSESGGDSGPSFVFPFEEWEQEEDIDKDAEYDTDYGSEIECGKMVTGG
ncbi:phosphatase 2C-like domain-containing protein [Mycena floridula]|nr:phosphatase 2C-like domain-containing protein [Mycena floridula]